MAFKKGDEKPHGSGRKKGVGNKKNENLREQVGTLLAENYELFKKKMAKLEPPEFCRTYLQLMKFRLPTYQSVAFEDSENTGKNATFEYLVTLRDGSGKDEKTG